ncbi:Hypothetical predicted protein, partial [Xyrichtys novacula]
KKNLKEVVLLHTATQQLLAFVSALFLLLLWFVLTCPGACLDQNSVLLCPAARPPVE